MGSLKRWFFFGLCVVLVGVFVATRDEASTGDDVSPFAGLPSSGASVGAGVDEAADEGPGYETGSGDRVVPGGEGLSDQTGEGALRAVLVFLELSEELILMSPEDAGATQRAYATVSRRDEASVEIAAQVAELQSAAGDGIHLDVAPISWSVRELVEGAEYVVDVWYLEVFGLGDSGDAAGSFKTYSAQVVWEDGGWKLLEAASVDGPHPVVRAAPSSGPQLRRQLTGFGDGGPVAPLVLDLSAGAS